MKTIFILILAFCLVSLSSQEYTKDQMKKLRQLKKDCIEETTADSALVENFYKGDSTNDPNVKCFASCMLTQTASMSSTGDVDINTIKELVPDTEHKGMYSEILNTCKTKKGKDLCDKAYNVYSCLMQDNSGILKIEN